MIPGQPRGPRPRLLDLYCCQGGASAGYAAAGFDVTGVDIAPQPHYPYRFVQAEALTYLAEHGSEFDAIHASPPCQARSNAQRIQGRDHPALIAPTRELLIASGRPWVIENVVSDSPDDPLIDPVLLCGAMFAGLRVYRHRLFEASFALDVPAHPAHLWAQRKMGRPPREGDFVHVVGNFSGVPYAKRAMGIDWMTRDGLREAIPPKYAEHVGRQLFSALPVCTPVRV